MGSIVELENEINRLKRELENYKRESDAILSASLLLNTTLDLKELLLIILKQSAILCDAEASSLALIDDENDELIFEVSVGDSSNIIESMRIPKNKGIIGWVIENDKELLIEDCKNDHRFYSDVDKKTSFETRSIMAVPLKTKHGVIGGVELLNKKKSAKFNDNDLKVIKVLSAQAALAIENARLYQSILEEKNKISSIIEAIGDGIIVTNKNNRIELINPVARKILNSNSDESRLKLQIILDEIKNVGEYGEFDIVLMKPENMILSNNITILKNSLGEFIGHVISLRNITMSKKLENDKIQFVNLLGNKVLSQLKGIVRTSDLSKELDRKLYDLNSWISKFVYFTEIISGPLRINRFKKYIGELIKKDVSEITQKYDISPDSIDLKLIGNDIEVDIDEEKFKECLKIIIDNSIKYFSENSLLKIEINIKKEDDYIIISLVDRGIGMSDSEIYHVLDRESIIERVSETKNFSMGLLYVKHVVEAHGGNIHINSEVGEGTEVILKIPIILL